MSLRAGLFAVLLIVPWALVAQAPDAAALSARSRQALVPVQALVGRWEGEALVWEGPGEPRRVRQSEDISFAAAGTVIVIRGTGRDPGNGNVIFEAAATLWFDPEANRLRMRTHRDGNSLEPEVDVRPDTLTWSFRFPAGRMRYVIALTDSTWHEVGFFERPGAPTVRTIDMRLRRTGR